jgi:hypothetical protein
MTSLLLFLSDESIGSGLDSTSQTNNLKPDHETTTAADLTEQTAAAIAVGKSESNNNSDIPSTN